MSKRQVHAQSLSKRQRERVLQSKKLRARRKMQLEFLEQRQLLAVGPRLLDAETNFGEALTGGSTLSQSPRELTLSFASSDPIDAATIDDGISIVRSGGDGTFNDGNELTVDSAFVGLGDVNSEVLIRFAETLPDDSYQLTIRGTGTPLTDIDGDPYNEGVDTTTPFGIDNASRVLSVVPQPVVRDPSTDELSQLLDEIHVYFDDDMVLNSVEDPAFYQLEDKGTGDIRLPSSATYDSSERMVVLKFDSDLPAANFHLQIGEHNESNSSLDSAINVGTITQQSPFAVYETPIDMDSDGNPITFPIPDGGTLVSSISVDQDVLIGDVNVEVDIDHEAGEDLQIFLVSPSGRRVELVRDLGSDELQGQIYGTKFNDLDGDGVQDPNEPGLAGWTIFLDTNDNAELDSWERSTVTDAEGRYAFTGLPYEGSYYVAEVPQPFWQQTSVTTGGTETLFEVDFANGATQYLDVIPDENGELPDDGLLNLFYDGVPDLIFEYTGVNQEMADQIQEQLQIMVDRQEQNVTVDVQVSTTTLNRFEINFTYTGVGTPYDASIIQVIPIFLNRGSMELVTNASTDGFYSTSINPGTDEWHLSKLKTLFGDTTPVDAFYFGTEPTPPGTVGQYQNNAQGSLFSPEIDLSDPALVGDIDVVIDHYLRSESGFDFADIYVNTSEGERVLIDRLDGSTGGFTFNRYSLNAYRGQLITLEFEFTSDGSVTEEGWFIDYIAVEVERGVEQVIVNTVPQNGFKKNVELGSSLPTFSETNDFGYRAEVVGTDFEDISGTGERILQEFVGNGFALDIGGTATEQANAISRDSSGNLYLTGFFQGTVDFDPSDDGTFNLTSNGVNDIFVAKYAADGTFINAVSFGDTGVEDGQNIAVDDSGNVYLTGSFEGSIDIGATTLTSNGGSDLFVAKLDTDLNALWALSAGSATADAGRGIALDNAGNVLVTGEFTGTTTFGTTPLTSAGSSDAFVWLLDNDGNHAAAFSVGSNGNDRGSEIAVDSDGNVTIAGRFSNTVDFNLAGGVNNVDALTSAGSTDGFVVQYAPDGTFRWVDGFASTALDEVKAVTIDADDNVIVTGAVNNDIVVAKYSQDGVEQWTRTFGSSSTDSGEDVAVDASGRVYVTGSFRGAFSGIDSNGGTDIFLLRLDAAGATDVLVSMGGNQDDAGFGVVSDGNGNFVHAGSFRSTVDFELGPTTDSLTAVGSQDAYLATYATIRGVDDGTHFISSLDLTDPDDGDVFEFSYYDAIYGDLYVSTNGLVTFINPNASPDNGDLTTAPTQASILPFWEDLFTQSGPDQAVFWEVRGEGDRERLIIQWNNVRLDGIAGADDPPLTFQMVLREIDGSIQFNYQNVTDTQFIPGDEVTVGTFEFGSQVDPSIASDAAGNTLVVWESPGQDGDLTGVYGRRYDAAGVPIGDEFLINETTFLHQRTPDVSMADDGRFVVTWVSSANGMLLDIMARLYAADGTPVTGEFVVNGFLGGSQDSPSVEMDANGDFVVGWSGEGVDDNEGVYLRRFAADGTPIDALDEIQTIEFLGPPQAPRNFTLFFGSAQTGNISYAGVGNGNLTAQNIQNRLRSLPSLGPDVTVTPIALNEVQTIRLTGAPTTGDFTLSYQGTPIANAIAYNVDPDVMRGDIETELRNLGNIDNALTVTLGGPGEFIVTFRGADRNQDLPLIQVTANTLDPATTIDVEETVKGSNPDERFRVEFLGVDGGQDQPLITLGDFSNGVTHIVVEEVQAGSTGDILVNTDNPEIQENPTIAKTATGEFTVAWESDNQDGSGWGIYGKNFDADAQATPADQNEIQECGLQGPPAIGSDYTLRHEGQNTGTIVYTGNNVADVASITAAFNGIGRNVIVNAVPGDSDEVQLIRFTRPPGNPTTGTFRLAHAGQITGLIDFEGTTAANGVTTANNIAAALNALPNTAGVNVVPAFTDAAFDFLVTFAGASGGVDHPLMLFFQNNLDDGTATISEINNGGRNNLRYSVEFVGADGNQDRGDVTLQDNTGGVVAIDQVTIQNGNNAEFLIPENTLDDQLFPHITPNPAGGFLAVWRSPDGDATGVFGRLFDSNGAATSSEFQINTLSEGTQNLPQATFLANGDFLVTWFGPNLDPSLSTDIFARRFTGGGIALGDEFVLNQVTVGPQSTQDITPLSGGGYAIAFESSAGGGGIHLQYFDANDNPVGAEQTISQFGLPNQTDVDIARNASGQSVVVWTELVRDTDGSRGIYAQTFNSDGSAASTEFRVTEIPELDQTDPVVGIDDSGNVVVVWRTTLVVPDPDNPGFDKTIFHLRGRRFDFLGNDLSGGEFEPFNPSDNSIEPLLSVAGDGKFVIGLEPINGLLDWTYEVFDAAGNSINGATIELPEWNGIEQWDVEFAPSGNFFVVSWDAPIEDADGIQSNNAFIQIFEPDGTPRTQPLRVHDEDSGSFTFIWPDVGIDDSDTISVAYGDLDSGAVLVRRFNSSGIAISDPLDTEVPSGFFTRRFAVSRDGSSSIVWSDATSGSANVFAQRLTQNGLLMGQPVQINQGGIANVPEIAADGNGEFTVAWIDASQGEQVRMMSYTSDFPSVGIRDAEANRVGGDPLQIWVDGSRTQLVGSGISTRISVVPQVSDSFFAVSNAGDSILELDAATGATLNSIPTPVSTPGAGALAQLGDALYFVADGDTTLYELDIDTGAWTDTVDLAALGLSNQIDAVAVLNGKLVFQDLGTGLLTFFDPFSNEVTGSITPAVAVKGGLVGGGDRGTLFAVNSGGDVVELNSDDGSVVNTLADSGDPILGLAFVQGVLMLARGSAIVTRMDPNSGAPLGTFTTSGPVSSLGGDGGGGIAQAFDPILEPLDVLLDDEASTPITSGEGPYVGSYRPSTPLSQFDGEQTLGTWDLEVRDALTGDVGELNQWRLIFNQPEDTPADFATQGFIGDELGLAANDVDLYRVNFLDAGTVDIVVQPDAGLSVTVRLFDEFGNELARETGSSAGALERLTAAVPAAGTYFVGVSSSGNDDYNARDNSTATGGSTTGRYELEIRYDQVLEYDDDNSSYNTATDVGILGDAGFMRAGEIDSPNFTLRLPGGNDDPGHRDIPAETHLNGGPRSNIVTAAYNFQDVIGTLPSGDPAFNSITENQKDRAREIFEIYGEYLGIQFFETANQGLTVATGDMRALSPTIPVGPGGVGGISSGSLNGVVIMDAAEGWGTSLFGGGWFQVAMHEIGHSMGLGHTYEQPALTVMGDRPQNRFDDNPEPIFPGGVDVIHSRHLLPPSARDLDLYRFETVQSGTFTAETFAERFSSGVSHLDTEMSLYREVNQNGRVTRELIASNDDYFGDDSRIAVHLDAGVYYLGVHSAGLAEIDPSISDSGFGGISDGRYEVELDFAADAKSGLQDTGGASLDGDSDGFSGGQYDFWFQSGPTIFVDKMNDTSTGPDGSGSLADPFDNIQSALTAAAHRIVVPTEGVDAINDGDSLLIIEPNDARRTFVFEIGAPSGIADRITIASDATDEDVAQAIADAINDPDLNWNVTATVNGSIVEFSNIERRDLAGVPGLISSSNLVRIVGNGGGDGIEDTVGDNLAYLIGEDNDGNALVDGTRLNVPQGVTLMVDASTLFKLQRSIIDVGTASQNINRAGAAIQLLGTPGDPVLFRSLRNDAFGGDSDGPGIPAEPGDWGGIVIRDDSDLEDHGIFLNHINMADLNNGGGKVVVDSVEQTFTPVHLFVARPTISNLTIRGSADAAISADPNSFEESLGRVGPDVHNNLIVNNTINGLFVRIRTDLGQPLDRLEVPARFDDIDIVHVLTETLQIAGNPGGHDQTSGQLVARSGARLTVDPGMIVKLEGSRIEVQIGAQMIAEGAEGSEIIFTALKDDTFGAGGTSDTSNDGTNTSPEPGQWGGIYFGHASSGSLDRILLQYGGGETAIEGDFDNFNPVEIFQADVRIANSEFRDNASGRSRTDRNGRGRNDDAVIFVRGAQPIIVNNRIYDNVDSKAITINVSALEEPILVDSGRQTGFSEAFTEFNQNHGPLIRLNRLQNNDLDGMEVRGGVLKTEGVWDDVDITHVVRDEIKVPNFHSLGGLRLQSDTSGSLVIKLEGADAGFTATGDPLDISDRIGGSLYVLGVPSRPVVFTSIDDDTVAAGFDLSGDLIFDVNNDGSTTGQAGDWRSVRLDRFSNDRNVAVYNESEGARIGLVDANATPATAEFLGTLSVDDKNGDDDRRVGFTVHGRVALDDANDADVYSFDATPGTEVWIDIDRTDFSLDTVVELIDADGVVLARSIDNTTLAGLAQPLTKDSVFGPDLYTANPRDAGMRLILPSGDDSVETYYVRVRSAVPTEVDPESTEERSRGSYQLQVRLRQVDEVAGSTIRAADIRYATNGIEVLGLPAHSHLTGEAAESSAGNDSFGSAQDLGNLLVSERATISLGGELSNENDIDWYQFELDIDQIQSIGGVNDGGKTWSTVFDIDYADGLARPDTVLAVFDENGVPILISRDSNVQDDQGQPGQGADTEDLTRGSFGSLDPFIGSVQMPTGVIPAGSSQTYFVAVSSNGQLPTALSGTFNSGSGSSLVRLEPVNSVRRIAEDHIGFSGHTTGTADGAVQVNPVQSLFDINSAAALETHVIDLTLNEMVLYVGGPSGLSMVNPFTGQIIDRVGDLNVQTTDFAMRTDGRLFAVRSLFQGNPPPNNAAGELVAVDPTTAGENVLGNDGIPDFNPATNPPNIQELTSNFVDAFAYDRIGFDNDNNVPVYGLYYAVRGHRIPGGSSTAGATLYRANPANGSAVPVAGQPWGRVGTISTSFTPTGMAFVNGQLHGVDDAGNFFRISTFTGAATPIANLGFNFEGLSVGPQNLQDGAFSNLLFGVTGGGTLVAFDTNGVQQGVFSGGSSTINTGVSSTGLAFSPMDFNLWHPTLQRRDDAGHGINTAFDLSRDDPSDFARPFDTDEAEGGVSFYFGLEDWPTPNDDESFINYGSGQYGVISDAHRDLSTNPAFANNYNLPGGALGSLATSQFSLAGYDSADKPTIYFNYFLETENANSDSNEMRDSFRVQLSTDGGLSWDLLATNNSVLDEELPEFVSTSSNASFDFRQRVQELFDNTGGWRQARVDLSEFAGASNIQVRFDFSTSGSMDQGVPGDFYGDLTDVSRAENNNFEGVYIDDVIIGFAERGEMVTNTNPSTITGFFNVPRSANAPEEVLAGRYQLEIRRGTEYGANVTNADPEIVVGTQFDTNDRLILGDGIDRFGDQNTRRETGQIQIEQNSIRDALQFGILVDAGARDSDGNLPSPSPVRNLPTINTQRLVPGITIENNVISSLGQGGILFSGDPNSGASPTAAVPYGRILHNTIYGGTQATAIGVQVTQNASPTMLNNIVANTSTAISIDGTSASTVVGATLLQGNSQPGNFSDPTLISLAPTDPLFVDPDNGVFYLSQGSLAIDSSRNSLEDRPSIVAVKSPLGISPSPITTPDRDLFNQFRIDDPTQDPPPGLGSDIFKDRGAIERADFIGPFVRLIVPEDNDAAGIDLDKTITVVQLASGDDLTSFQILFSDDPGIGPNPATITAAAVTVTENGVELISGTDYTVRYNPNSGILNLIPTSGQWASDAVYVITLDNTIITDLAGNPLQPNRPDGSTQFTILMPDVQLDFGDAPDSYNTLGTSAGPRHAINGTQTPRLGTSVDSEINGQPVDLDDVNGIDDEDGVPVGSFNGTSSTVTGLVLADGTTGETSLAGEVVAFLNRNDAAGAVLPIRVTGTGVVDAWIDFNRDGDFNESNERVLSGVAVVDGLNQLRVFTPTNASIGMTYARFRISSQGTDSPGGIANNGEVEDYPIGIFDVDAADAFDDDFYTVDEDHVLTVDGINFPGLVDNDLLPTDEFVQPQVVVNGPLVPHPTDTIFKTANGQVRIDDPVLGLFTYTPDLDFEGVDSFEYAISTQRNEGAEFINVADFATVTITVSAFNAPPVFDIPSQVEVSEDNPETWVIENFFTNVSGGAPEFGDDEMAQTVTFTIVEQTADPTDLMERLPDVSSGSSIEFFPGRDQFGEVTYVVTATDDGVPIESSSKIFTVFVRPINDPPRFDPDVAGTGQVNNPDDAWEVARVEDTSTGEVIDGTISYTLREDNSQPIGAPSESYFIPFQRDPNATGYSLIGLMDVFTVGPENEADPDVPGGGQTLFLDNVPTSTVRGGTLTLSQDQLGVFYTPPLDYNFDIGGPDSFVYSVIDDGESFENGELVPDPKVSENTVLLILNPVNDKPQFDLNLGLADPMDPSGPRVPLETIEDGGPTRIDNFAVLVNAGPPATAIDEVNNVTGQKVEFVVTPLSYPESESSDFFTVAPTISVMGRLDFEPAPDAFGSFEFEIVLMDDGLEDFDRGDLAKSDPMTITINVLPVNDPPVLRPDVDPLVYTIQEDTDVDILSVGTPDNPGMLDVFAVGPDNEGEDITPGGNQTLAIKEPTPAQTVFGGTITQIIENGMLVGLNYTPRENFVGTDSFTYTVIDDGTTVEFGTGGLEVDDPRIASNTVSIEVLPINDPPQFSGPSNVTIDEDDGAVTIADWATNVFPGPPTATDEIDNQGLEFTITQIGGDFDMLVGTPVAVIDTDTHTADLQFEAFADANGIAIFETLLTDIPSDGTPAESTNVRTFTITVNSVNDPPTFTPGGPVVVDEDSGPYTQTWATDISPGPADEADQTVRFEVETPTESEHLFQQLPEISDAGILRFVSAPFANGSVDLVVTAIDSGGAASDSVVLTLTITPVNNTPTAVPDETDTDEDTALNISVEFLLENDIDPDIDNPDDFLTVVMEPESFSVSGARVLYDSATGQITYDPSTSISLQALPEDGVAVDSFPYRVVDSQGALSNITTVAVTVFGINDAPVARPDNPTLNPDGVTVIDVLENDTDVDSIIDPLSIQITLPPAFGGITIDDMGVITYTPSSSFDIEDVFEYRVADFEGKFSEEVFVTISANAAPIARDDQATTFLNEAIVINVAANDVDPDAEPGEPNGGLDLTSIQIVNGPSSGDAVPLGDGTIRYIPGNGFLGIDSFQYTIEDTEGRVSSPGTVDVQVVGSRLQNPDSRFDVNDDGSVSPQDALLIINHLARDGSGSIPVEDTDFGPNYYDVNANKIISPNDALEVINELSRRQAAFPQGELVGEETPLPFVAQTVSTTEPLAAELSEIESAAPSEKATPVASFGDVGGDVDASFIDLIAESRDDDEDEDRVAALDIAFGDLL